MAGFGHAGFQFRPMIRRWICPRSFGRDLAYCVIVAASALAQAPSNQTELKEGVDISGTWEVDRPYFREYMKNGRDLQVKWCGQGWSDAEIERRLARVDSIVLRYEIQRQDAGSYTRKIFNETGHVRDERLTHCATREDRRLECENEKGEKFYFRVEKQTLWVDMLVKRSMMNCARQSGVNDEAQWMCAMRMLKSK